MPRLERQRSAKSTTSKGPPCLAMHLVMVLSAVMLVAVMAISASLISISRTSRIVLYQTVAIDEGRRGEARHDCEPGREAGSGCRDVHLETGQTVGGQALQNISQLQASELKTQVRAAQDVLQHSTGTGSSDRSERATAQHVPGVATGQKTERAEAVIDAFIAAGHDSDLSEGTGSTEQEQADGEDDDDAGESAISQEAIDNLKLGFKLHVPNSLTYEDVRFCPGSEEPSVEQLQPIPSDQKVLYLMSTSLLARRQFVDALTKHPAFRIASMGFATNSTARAVSDLHFFNRWPLPKSRTYLDFFDLDSEDTAGLGEEGARHGPSHEPILLDATFDYFTNAVVAPRMQAIVPQARFVLILQDPAIRAMEQWRSLHHSRCPHPSPENPCVDVPTFEDLVVGESSSATTMDGCFFDQAGTDKTWNDCFGCSYSHVDLSYCGHLQPEHYLKFSPCRLQQQGGISMLSGGNYAALLGWWLSFFPPERFLVIPANNLRNSSGMKRVLKQILQHAGADPTLMPSPPPKMPGVSVRLNNANTNYLQKQALFLLRERYKVQLSDLDALMDLVLPDVRFTGIPSDIPEEFEVISRQWDHAVANSRH